MVSFTSYYYCLPKGRVPVKELEEFGPKLPMPHARHLGKGLYELRFKGPDGAIRILYFFIDGTNVIFVHAFKKSTKKAPKGDIDLGYKRMRNYLKYTI